MRRATHDTQWLTDANGRLQGIALGFDFAAEHEWGIKKLKEAFGIPDTKFPQGIKDRQIRTLPEDLMIYREFSQKPEHDKRKKAETFGMLAYAYMGSWSKHPAENLKEATMRQAKPYDAWSKEEAQTLGAAWDESSFGIVVRERDLPKLRELKEAFEHHDIAIAPGKQRGFDRSHGLTFVIVSRLESEIFEKVLEADKAHQRLEEAADATGIIKRLKAAKKDYFACSPRWKNSDETTGEVVFWLNPMHQKDNNFGWFTVQDLDDWIAGIGRIPMRKA